MEFDKKEYYRLAKFYNERENTLYIPKRDLRDDVSRELVSFLFNSPNYVLVKREDFFLKVVL